MSIFEPCPCYLCGVILNTTKKMALFKVTTKRLLNICGKRLEAGMTAEVSHNGNTLPNTSAVRDEIHRQFKVKYNVDFPKDHINPQYLNIEKI